MKTNFTNGMLLVVLLALIARPLLTKKDHQLKIVRWVVAAPNNDLRNLVDTTIEFDLDHADSTRAYWTGYCDALTHTFYKGPTITDTSYK